MGISIREKLPGAGPWIFVRHNGIRWSKKIKGGWDVAAELKKKLQARADLDLPLFPEKSNAPSLREYFKKDFQKHLDSVSPRTRESYTDSFSNYIEPKLGSFPLDKIKRKQVKDFISDLKKHTFTPKGKKKKKEKETRTLAKDSIRIIYSLLRTILSEAVDDEYIQSNPATKMGKTFKEVENAHDVRPLNDAEAEALLNSATEVTPWYFPLFAWLLHTGTRIGEASALRWTDVDLFNAIAHVKKSSSGKTEGPTKTRRTRQVELVQFVVSVLQQMQRDQRERFGELPEFVFCTQSATKLDIHNFRYQQFKRVLKQAKIEKCRVHDLRHTFATLHLQKGSALQWVSKQLGHASIKMTADTYYHYLPEAKRDRSNVLPTVALDHANNLILMKAAGAEDLGATQVPEVPQKTQE